MSKLIDNPISGGGGVTGSSDNSLTIAGADGIINVAHSNTWTAQQDNTSFFRNNSNIDYYGGGGGANDVIVAAAGQNATSGWVGLVYNSSLLNLIAQTEDGNPIAFKAGSVYADSYGGTWNGNTIDQFYGGTGTSSSPAANSVLFQNSAGNAYSSDVGFIYNATTNNLLIASATITPASKIHIDAGTSTASDLRFTVGSTTGQTSSDGFQIGITSAGVAEIRQRENLALEVYTNNTKRIDILADGKIGIGTAGTVNAKLDVLSTTEQLRLLYNSSNSVQFTVDSSGNLALQTTAGATAGVYTLTPHGAGGDGTNRTISFGRAWGNAALWLYNNGAGSRFGWGMRNDAMQFFAPTLAGTFFSWNYGGDLQANGTNEIMRLVQYTSGTGAGLGMGSIAFQSTTPHRIDFSGVSGASASVATEDILRFSRAQTNGVSYPQAFTMAIGRYVAPTTYSPNSSVDFRLKHSSSSNITTDIGVMSLNSNARVLIGAIGAAGSTCDVAGSLQCDSITNDTGLASGTYTPTLTNTTNIAASTAYTAQYMRVGSVVTVSGKVNIDPTAAGAILLEMSLPVASNFSAEEQCGGNATTDTALDDSLAIAAEVTNNRASFHGTAISTVNSVFHFTFTYLVV